MHRTTRMQKLSHTNERLLLVSLSRFYHCEHPTAFSSILPVIEGSSHVSLRIIDYFLTSYLKRHPVVIERVSRSADGGSPVPVQFPVQLSYQSQLTAYTKHAFDCFRRGKRILFAYGKDKTIETTIGQLNLFRWLLSHGVLEYIEEHLSVIKEDMLRQTSGSMGKLPPSGTPAVLDTPVHKEAASKPAMKRYIGATTVSFA